MPKDVLYLFLFGLAIAIIATAAYGIYDTAFDSQGYIKATEILQGKAVFVEEEGIVNLKGKFLRPMQLVLNSIEPIPLKQWFYFLNVLFFLATGLLVYRIVELLFERKQLAFFSGIVFYSSAVAAHYSLSLLVEAGTYFFYALGIVLILLYYKKYPGSKKLAFAAAFVCGLGVLMKESAGIGIILLVLLVLLSKKFREYSFAKRLGFGTVLFAVFLIPTAVTQALVFVFLDYTYLNYLAFQLSTELITKPLFTLPRFVLAAAVGFSILIPGFFYALWIKIKSQEMRLAWLLIFIGILPSAMFLVAYDRIFFMVFPIAIPFGIFGTRLFFKKHFPSREKFLFLVFLLGFVALNTAGLVLYRDSVVATAVAVMF